MSATELKAPHKVKIRKDHICQGCGKKLPKGEEVWSSSYSSDGKAWTFWECDKCHEFNDTYCRTCENNFECIGFDYRVGLLDECRHEREFTGSFYGGKIMGGI